MKTKVMEKMYIFCSENHLFLLPVLIVNIIQAHGILKITGLCFLVQK